MKRIPFYVIMLVLIVWPSRILRYNQAITSNFTNDLHCVSSLDYWNHFYSIMRIQGLFIEIISYIGAKVEFIQAYLEYANSNVLLITYCG
jgi:hypothetical protein